MKLLFFNSPMCGPCRTMKPIVAEVAAANPTVTIESVDTSADRERTKNAGVRFVPTFIVLDDQGNEVTRVVGVMAKPKLVELLGIKTG